MVMIEAMVTGTPVIAFREGAANEIVDHGGTGFLVGSTDEMAACVSALDLIDPHTCRATVIERYDVPIVSAAYEAVYERASSSPARGQVIRHPARATSGDGARLATRAP
jgi:glycosyltransferase involved in cell wall biosynthesis